MTVLFGMRVFPLCVMFSLLLLSIVAHRLPALKTIHGITQFAPVRQIGIHSKDARLMDGTGLPVPARAIVRHRQPQATVGRWVIISTAVIVTRMVVRQRPADHRIVSKVCKFGAAESAGA